MTSQSVDRNGDVYGGLLLKLHDPEGLQPITFPFNSPNTTRGNHVKLHDNTTITNFDYWHSGVEAESNTLFVAERGIGLEGRMVGENAAEVLRGISHRVLTVNEGVKREDRLNMLETVYNTVYPHLTGPAFISMAVQSSQPKFLLFSKGKPIYINVFVDEHCTLLTWSSRPDMDARMREVYGSRFSLFRMQPIIDGVVVLHTFYLKKKFTRWKWKPEMQETLRLLNALDATIQRRTLSEHTQRVPDNDEEESEGQPSKL